MLEVAVTNCAINEAQESKTRLSSGSRLKKILILAIKGLDSADQRHRTKLET
jgi:hypothetical protein